MKLHKEIDNLKDTCKLLLGDSVDEEHKESSDIVLRLKTFSEIIKECKSEVESSDLEHKKHVLKLLYGVTEESFDLSLDDCIMEQQNMERIEVDKKHISNLKQLIGNIDEIIEKLDIEYNKSLFSNKKWYVFNGFKLKKYAKYLKILMDLKEKLEGKLESDSKKISFLIIENFYNLYIFFSFLVGICISNKNEMLLIEIASSLDSYIEVIEPSFKNRSLHHDDMLHYYTIYELKELKDQIFKELSFQ